MYVTVELSERVGYQRGTIFDGNLFSDDHPLQYFVQSQK